MPTADASTLPATEMVRLFRARELSPIEVVDAVLDRAERLQPELNCFYEIDRAEAASAGIDRCTPDPTSAGRRRVRQGRRERAGVSGPVLP